MERVHDGDPVSVIGGEVYIDGDLIARGNRQTPESIAATHELSRASIGIELNRFVQNTVEYISTVPTCSTTRSGCPTWVSTGRAGRS